MLGITGILLSCCLGLQAPSLTSFGIILHLVAQESPNPQQEPPSKARSLKSKVLGQFINGRRIIFALPQATTTLTQLISKGKGSSGRYCAIIAWADNKVRLIGLILITIIICWSNLIPYFYPRTQRYVACVESTYVDIP